MILGDPKIDDFRSRWKRERKSAERADILNTCVAVVVAAALAYWAYGTLAHAVLFAFLVFAVAAVGNRVCTDLRQYRAQDEGRKLVDEHFDKKGGE